MNVDVELLIKGLVMTGLMKLEKIFAGRHRYSPGSVRGKLILLPEHLGYGPVYSEPMQANAISEFPVWDETIRTFEEDLGVPLDEEKDYFERIKVDSKRWRFKKEAVA